MKGTWFIILNSTQDELRGINQTMKMLCQTQPSCPYFKLSTSPKFHFLTTFRNPSWHNTNLDSVRKTLIKSITCRCWGGNRPLHLESREGGADSVENGRVWTGSHYPNWLGRLGEGWVEQQDKGLQLEKVGGETDQKQETATPGDIGTEKWFK